MKEITPGVIHAPEVISAEVTPRPERLAVLTPGGPLLIDITLTVDGGPHGALFDELIQKVCDAGDTNGDGRSTWKEWKENREFFTSPLAGTGVPGARQLKTWIERYDENGDGQMHGAEAASWLGRDAGQSMAPFSVRSRRSFRTHGAADSRLWRVLDGDGDGRLSQDEINSAPRRLLPLDANDDRLLESPELAPLLDQITPAPVRPDRDQAGQRHAALRLSPEGPADRLDFVLSDLYAPRRYLGPESFPDFPDLFAKLNANEDDWLDRAELTRLATIGAHVELAVDFSRATESSASTATAELLDHEPAIVVESRSAANRLVLTAGGTRLIVSANDLTLAGMDEAPTAACQIRAVVHDQCDMLLMELDANGDGRLGPRELEQGATALRALDANDDGVVAPSELQPTMIVAILRGEPLTERSFYVPPADDPSVAPTADWFQAADLNGDGDVSRREFLGSFDLFDRLDANGDGYLSADEAPP